MAALVYGLEKFHHYTFGRDVSIITDHKPLVAIASKPLSKAPRRLQNLLLRAQKYSFDLKWQPGTALPLADTLSRAPSDERNETDEVFTVTDHHIPDQRLVKVRGATVADHDLQLLSEVIMSGWPRSKYELPAEIRTYFDYRDELSVLDGIVYRSDRVVIPKAMRPEMKQKVHAGHLGINSCIRRARDVVFWPGMNSEIRTYIESCGTCSTYSNKQPSESAIISSVVKYLSKCT